MHTTPDEPDIPGGIPSFSDMAREVLRALPDVALFVFDHELRFLFCDGASLLVAGHDPLALEGKTVRDAFGAEAAAIEPIYSRALAGETVDVEVALHGREFSIRAAPRLAHDGRIVGGSLLSVDVTDQRRAERAVREGIERVERIASNVPGVVYRAHIAPDGTISYPYVSDGIRGILGIAPAALQADPGLLLRLIHPDDLANFQRAMVAIAGLDLPSLWEGRMLRADGEVRWLRIACARARATSTGRSATASRSTSPSSTSPRRRPAGGCTTTS
jgi:PAS domain-containing protein